MIVAAYSQMQVVSRVAASSDQGSHMAEITGISRAALQRRPRAVFPVMTSSLVPEWDLKGAVPGQVCLAVLHAGLVHSFLLCQTWSKCIDDKIARAPFFFLRSIFSLHWQSRLFPPRAESWWMPRLHRHSYHVQNIKVIRSLDQFSWGIL